MRVFVLGAGLLLAATCAAAQETPTLWSSAEVQWSDDMTVPGGRRADLWGDARSNDQGTLHRWKFNTKVPAVTRSHTLHIVVLTGTFTAEIDGVGYREFGPGAFVRIPTGVKHSVGCEASGECNFVSHRQGPVE